MDTIKSTIASASKYVYGDDASNQSGQEPISGQQGKGTADEPFDAGNQEENPDLGGRSAQDTSELHPASPHHGPHPTYAGNMLDPRTASAAWDETFGSGAHGRLEPKPDQHSLSREGGTAGFDDKIRGSAHTSSLPGATNASTTYSSEGLTKSGNQRDRVEGSRNPFHGSSSAGQDASQHNRASDTLSGGSSSENTGGGIAAGQPRPLHETDKTGVTDFNQKDPKGSDVRPTEANEDRPNKNAGGFGTAEPSVGAHPESAQNPNERTKQQGADRPSDAPDAEESAAIKGKKEQGEEALEKRDPNDHSGEPMHMHEGDEKKEERSESVSQPGGGEVGKEKGTGEQWVKTSGVAAEGGDFDATKPGAGKEANRLLDEKGVHRTKPGEAAPPADEQQHAEGDHAKHGAGQKIKDKLHMGKH